MFGRSRFAKIAEAQLDLFLREQRDVVAEVEERLGAYNRADRAEAEELYGDYVDAVESRSRGPRGHARPLRTHVDDADDYIAAFNRAVAKRLPAYAAAVENR